MNINYLKSKDMKKLVFICFFLVAIVADAQIVGSTSSRITITRVKSNRIPILYVDVSPGYFFDGPEDGGGIGIDYGIRCTKMFGRNIGWDILRVSLQHAFEDSAVFQVKTGIRGVSPVLFGKYGAIYGNLLGGVSYCVEHDDESGFGVGLEGGVGVNFNRHIALGLVCTFGPHLEYKHHDYNPRDYNFVGLRLSYGF